jgi:hypothetical protein
MARSPSPNRNYCSSYSPFTRLAKTRRTDHPTRIRLSRKNLTPFQPRHNGRGLFRGHHEQQPNRPRSQRIVLYYVVEYLRATQDIGHILHKSSVSALRLYCEVDASSYLLHPDSKGHTGYNISFYGTTGTFQNRSVKQTTVATSSTHAEARAIFTLAKELNFFIALCQELHIPLELPSIIMEDNSAVVTMANNNFGYTKNCKHFLMVLNYIKEPISLEQIEARKIYGKLNTADMHTKPLRSPEFLTMAHKILGHPPPLRVSSSTPTLLQPTLSAETVLPVAGMDVGGQPSTEAKRSLTALHATTINAKRRKAHILRYVTCPPASDSTMGADVNDPAI